MASKRELLEWLTPGSAEWVIAHAKWRRQRGRKPSEPFGTIRNPRLALKAAHEELTRRRIATIEKAFHIAQQRRRA